MELKYILIVSLILAIITIGAVSATDSSDALADNSESGDEISPVNDGLLAADENPDEGNDDGSNLGDGENDPEEDTRVDISNFNTCPSDASVDSEMVIGSKIDGNMYSDVTGNITITIDGEKRYDEPVSLCYEEWDEENDEYVTYGGNTLVIKELGLKNGNHEVIIAYTGDDNYKPFNETYSMNLYFMNVSWYDEMVENSTIEIEMAKTATGNVEILIDNKSYLNLTAKQLIDDAWVKIANLEFGTHNYTVTYSDDELYKLDEPFEGEFTYTYEFYISTDDLFEAGIPYGETSQCKAYVPSANGVVVVSLNGKTFNVTPNERGIAIITIDDYELGDNEINFTYVSDKYPSKTVEKSFEVQPKIHIPYDDVEYGGDEAISLTLPADAIGYLEIYQEEYNETTYEHNWTLLDNITLKDGKAIYPVSKLPLGDYVFKLVYEGNYSEYVDIYPFNMKVIPTIIIDRHVYEGVNDNVKIILPDDYNKTVVVKIMSYEYDSDLNEGVYKLQSVLYNDTANGTLSFAIPKLDYELDYYLYVDDISVGFDYGTWVNVPENITSDGESIQVHLEGREGYVAFYIDGKLYKTEFLDADGIAYFYVNDLDAITHTYEISYFNASNEKIMTKTGTFNVIYDLYTNVDEEYALTKEFELRVYVPEDATNTITIDVNGKTYTATPINGTANVIITDLVMGENNLTITYNGDKKYPSKTIKEVMNVTGYGIAAKYNEETDEVESVSVLLPSNATGNLTLFKATYDDGSGEWISTGEIVKTVKLVDGYAIIETPELSIGNYGFIASYVCEGEQDYPVEDYEFEFTVRPDVNVTTEVIVGQNATISIYMPDAKGVVNVYICDDEGEKQQKITTIESDNGTFKTSLELGFGENNVELEYVGDDYEDLLGSYVIEVYPIKAELNKTTSDGTAVISLELPEGLSGKVTVYECVYDDEDEYYKEILSISNYTSQNKTFTVTGLKTGYNELIIVYANEKYGEYRFNEEFVIDKPSPASNMTIPETITSDSFDVVLSSDATGGIIVTIDGNATYIPLVNGTAKVDVSKLAEGKHNITVSYPGNSKYGAFEKTAAVTVPSPAVPVKIVAKDLSVQYLDGTKYSVTVYGTDGKVAAGVDVVFKINGKKVGSAKTDAKGVATLKITQVPKTYKITTEALGASVTKKLTVKQILTLKKVKVKKSAKKLVLTATLKKVKGKYLKGKKITFKFNGKKYTAKTNKKGVAKVTVKKSVLKKLKVGKKVKYTATYSKTTVKKTVKVKR